MTEGSVCAGREERNMLTDTTAQNSVRELQKEIRGLERVITSQAKREVRRERKLKRVTQERNKAWSTIDQMKCHSDLNREERQELNDLRAFVRERHQREIDNS